MIKRGGLKVGAYRDNWYLEGGVYMKFPEVKTGTSLRGTCNYGIVLSLTLRGIPLLCFLHAMLIVVLQQHHNQDQCHKVFGVSFGVFFIGHLRYFIRVHSRGQSLCRQWGNA